MDEQQAYRHLKKKLLFEYYIYLCNFNPFSCSVAHFTVLPFDFMCAMWWYECLIPVHLQTTKDRAEEHFVLLEWMHSAACWRKSNLRCVVGGETIEKKNWFEEEIIYILHCSLEWMAFSIRQKIFAKHKYQYALQWAVYICIISISTLSDVGTTAFPRYIIFEQSGWVNEYLEEMVLNDELYSMRHIPVWILYIMNVCYICLPVQAMPE